MVRSLIEASRLVAVHGEATRRGLLESIPANSEADPAEKIVAVRLGHGDPVSADRRQRARREVRAALGIADDAVLFGLFGGLTPEKRIPQVLAAMQALVPYAPSARLLLAGAPAAHYDVHAGIANGLRDRVTVTGYLAESELTDYLAACDVSLNLRWPTARETSGAWLRALAAGVPTIITDLIHLGGVPSLDPRTWTEHGPSALGSYSPKPVCVAIDILDEDHSLRLAMRRLAQDAELRERLGRAGRAWWEREHSLEVMVEDYVQLIASAAARPAEPRARSAGSPDHFRSDGDRRLNAAAGPLRHRGSDLKTITLNGDPHETAAATIADLLAQLEIDPRRVAVERNFVVIKRDAYATTAIEAGDQIEIVNFVGGG